MNRRSQGFLLSKAITGFLHLRQGSGSPQPHDARQLRAHPLTPKTIPKVWVALSSFFAWASTEFGWPDPIQDVPPPRILKLRPPSETRATTISVGKPYAFVKLAPFIWRLR
jgi:hypothetical protein